MGSWLLGAVLIEGDPEDIGVGQPVLDGAALGTELGWDEDEG